MMKYILHDWDNEQALLILKICVKSRRPRGKVLIIDNVIPEGNEPHQGKIHDIEMMAMTGGKERTIAEFERLFKLEGLELIAVTPTESSLSIVEAALWSSHNRCLR